MIAFASLALALVLAFAGSQAQSTPFSIAMVLARYEAGEYREFLDLLRSMPPTARSAESFAKEASKWVGEVETDRDRRTIVAAAVALELAHRFKDQPDDYVAQYLVWATLQMRHLTDAGASEPERRWYLAAMAGMETLDEPWRLTAGAPGSVALDGFVSRLGAGGFLASAMARFPAEPRFILARVEAFENSQPIRELGFAPTLLDFVKRQASGQFRDQDRRDPRWETGVRRFYQAVLDRYAEMPSVARAFEALADQAPIEAEVELHLGYVYGALADWPASLEHLHRVATQTQESYLRYVSEYLIGRVFQARNDHGAAVAAFDRALAHVPGAPSAITLLSAELLQTDRAEDRQRADRLMTAAQAGDAPGDPWRQFPHGDARLWPTYMAQLRQALR